MRKSTHVNVLVQVLQKERSGAVRRWFSEVLEISDLQPYLMSSMSSCRGRGIVKSTGLAVIVVAMNAMALAMMSERMIE